MTTFKDLELIEPLQRALAAENYELPTPIQNQAIPLLLAGRDVLGCAQTGTGKTAAFALPVLQKMANLRQDTPRRRIRTLVLSPTRELAAQIGERFRAYGRYVHLRHTVIVGGVSQRPQLSALQRGIDILVATPGRLLDLCGQGAIDLKHVEFFVLDEADRMLDMGFIHDIRRVLKLLPEKRQNLLFSATMPKSIVELASSFLDRPVEVSVTPQATTVEAVSQQVMFVDKADKKHLLAHLLKREEVTQSIVFTRTKHGANRLVKQLARVGIEAAAIHGNKSQNARKRALNGFRSGETAILIATDIASRGIDVDGVSHVFNYDLPNESESYVHRIGRTGRAGRTGIAIAFCDDSEGEYLRDIEKLTRVPIEVVRDHPWHHESAIPPAAGATRQPGRRPARNDSRARNRPPRRSGRPDRRDHQPRSAQPAGANPAQQQRRTGPGTTDTSAGEPQRRTRRRRTPNEPGAPASSAGESPPRKDTDQRRASSGTGNSRPRRWRSRKPKSQSS